MNETHDEPVADELRVSDPAAIEVLWLLYYRSRLWLDTAERERLREELDALWTRYAALSDQAAKPHPVLVHVVAVPER